jgi:vacuolar-type H+-ATPase subunit E/Vma4
MPYFEDDVYLYFKKEIEETGNVKIEALRKDIEKVKEKQLALIEEEIHETIYKAMQIELNEMSLDYSAQLNRIKLKAHQTMIKRKRELMDSVLLTVQEKLIEFTKSKEYSEHMKDLITKIDEAFCGDYMIFRIKKNDKTLKKLIEDNFNSKYKIEEIEAIKLGGFIAVCTEKGILTDQTIDYKLEERKTWFNQKMKFVIKEQ